jgi:hypothetical protein
MPEEEEEEEEEESRYFPSAEMNTAQSLKDKINISNEPPAAGSCTLLRQEAVEETYSGVHG